MNKVLIVDDHPVIRLAVRLLMERHGYEVSFAGIGAADPERGAPTQMAVFRR